MTTLSCQVCNTWVTTKLIDTTLVICKNCSAIVFAGLTDLQNLPASPPPEDWSFIQVGTTGIYASKPFDVIGRIRLQLRNDYKNIWCCAFEDGTSAWLMESFASFAMLESTWHDFTGKPKSLSASSRITLSKELVVTGEFVEKCEGVSYEGELNNWKYFSPDFFFFVAGSAHDAVLFVYEKKTEAIEYLSGKKVELNDLNLKNIILWNEWL